MDLSLRDKVALVTGGSRGLGRTICLGLAAEGAKVAVNYYRNLEKGIDLAGEATELTKVVRAAHGVATMAVPGDVSKADNVQEMFHLTETALGPVNILVNNAGIWPTAYVRDMTEEQWSSTLAINLSGCFLTCREAVRRWLDRAARAESSTSLPKPHFMARPRGTLITRRRRPGWCPSASRWPEKWLRRAFMSTAWPRG